MRCEPNSVEMRPTTGHRKVWRQPWASVPQRTRRADLGELGRAHPVELGARDRIFGQVLRRDISQARGAIASRLRTSPPLPSRATSVAAGPASRSKAIRKRRSGRSRTGLPSRLSNASRAARADRHAALHQLSEQCKPERLAPPRCATGRHRPGQRRRAGPARGPRRGKPRRLICRGSPSSRLGAGIGLLALDAPVAQHVERNPLAADRADDMIAGRARGSRSPCNEARRRGRVLDISIRRVLDSLPGL
jgi:hypothetical protein